MNKILSAVVVGVATVALMPAAAQEPGSRQTREFVEAAGQSDQFEILEAETVLGQTGDPQLRAFAQTMIRDHTRTNDALRSAAARAGLKPPPMGISPDQAALLGALQNQRAVAFDQTYIHHQALAHRSALTVERAYAANGDTPAVRDVAKAAIPIIASHLDVAEQMQAKSARS